MIDCPIEDYYGWLSEEFGNALPSEIIAEQRRLPVGFLEQLIEYRQYRRARAANEIDPKGFDKSPMRTLANRIEDEIQAAAIEQEAAEAALGSHGDNH